MFRLGWPPRNTYHGDTSSAETSRIPSYKNKHHGKREERKGGRKKTGKKQKKWIVCIMDIYARKPQKDECYECLTQVFSFSPKLGLSVIRLPQFDSYIAKGDLLCFSWFSVMYTLLQWLMFILNIAKESYSYNPKAQASDCFKHSYPKSVFSFWLCMMSLRVDSLHMVISDTTAPPRSCINLVLIRGS